MAAEGARVMLQKATILWAAAFGAVAAVGAGGAIWHLRSAAPSAAPPARMVASKAPLPSVPQSAASASAPANPTLTPGQPQPAPAPPSPAAVVPADAVTPSPQPKPAPSIQADVPRPQFDIVRIEASGEAVIAGHAAPKAKIAVTDHGLVVAEADADAAGQFVVLPPAFAPGGHALGLTARVGDGAPVQSPGVVGVDVPQPTQPAPAEPPKTVASVEPAAPKPAPSPTPVRKLVTAAAPPAVSSSAAQASLARAEPTKPAAPKVAQTTVAATTVAAAAPLKPAEPPSAKTDASVAAAPPPKPADPVVLARADAAAPAAAPPRTAITGVAADEAGRMVTTGVATPGALLRLYLNGSFLANVTAGAKGTWSLTIEHGMTGGAYAIRADEIDRAKGAVISRAEVPFDYPQHVAEAVAIAKPSAASAATSALRTAAASDQPKTSATTLASAQPQLVAPVAMSRALTIASAQPSSPPPASAAVQPPAAPSLLASAALTDASVQTVPPTAPRAEALAASPPPEPAANAVVKLIDTHKVIPGDNLWDISQHIYGNGLRYTQIYAANANQIRNPRLIYPGQIFVLPQATPF
jgi:hypothetical protein